MPFESAVAGWSETSHFPFVVSWRWIYILLERRVSHKIVRHSRFKVHLRHQISLFSPFLALQCTSSGRHTLRPHFLTFTFSIVQKHTIRIFVATVVCDGAFIHYVRAYTRMCWYMCMSMSLSQHTILKEIYEFIKAAIFYNCWSIYFSTCFVLELGSFPRPLHLGVNNVMAVFFAEPAHTQL